MLTILEIIKKTTDFFAAKGVENPRHDAETLVGHALGLKRMQLYLQFERLLTEPELAKIRPFVRRRSAREPLQHIVGAIEWGGVKLKTDSRALIPRHETELLFELALDAIAPNKLASAPDAIAPEAAKNSGDGNGDGNTGNSSGGDTNDTGDTNDANDGGGGNDGNDGVGGGKARRKILDLGTGSGALALALASACADARVIGVDSSDSALALARENAAALGAGVGGAGNTGASGGGGGASIAERVTFLKSDWFDALDPAEKFDLIVSNPPYLTEAEVAEAAPEVRLHEPRAALVAGENGCADLLRIIAAAPARLKENGLLALETGIAQHPALLAACAAAGFARCESRKDLTGRERFVFARVR